MFTGRWQSLPACIEALQLIAPRRVLDAGVALGRWGLLLHEFCERPTAAPAPRWRIHVEGIADSARDLAAHYARIHVGPAPELIARLTGPWDVTIYDGVLERSDKLAARQMLAASVQSSTYVLVNTRLGPNGAAHPAWEAHEFLHYPLLRRMLWQDRSGRSFGTFVLSRADPQNLLAALAPPNQRIIVPLQELGLTPEFERILRRLEHLRTELDFIKGCAAYRADQRLRASGVWHALRRLRAGSKAVVHVRALGTRSPSAQGCEVWLLHAAPNAGQPPLPWDFVERGPTWTVRSEPDSAFGQCLLAEQGWLRVPVGHDPELHFLRYPWSGEVELAFAGRRQVVDLYAPRAERVAIHPAREPLCVEIVPPRRRMLPAAPLRARRAVPPPLPAGQYSADEEAFIQKLRQVGARALAVHCPRWLGVSTSTRALFEHTYPVPETAEIDPLAYDPGQLEHHARVLAATGVGRLVFSGGDELHLLLAAHVRRHAPHVRFDMLWHGSYAHFTEYYNWKILRLWIDAVRTGLVHGIGTVKKGMERFLADLGVTAKLVLNYVPGDPQPPPALDDHEAHLGLWVSGLNQLKLPNATLAAVRMTPRARLHAAGLDPRLHEIIAYFQIPVARLEARPLPHAELLAAIRQTHLSLYVTFSECCPMLPLESLQAGVPCLIGPTSHLFEDNEYLFKHLVVPFPDRADVIADYIAQSLRDRVAIVEEYARYIPSYNSSARRSVELFLE